ncbi:MAG TPA: DUF6527 family protein [Thermoanaerobaculia bacterium]
MTRHTIAHEFVDFLPEHLEEGTLYVSMEYATAAHKCACGCGNDVITPLSPTDWKLTFDGRTISLYPSIGNWSFPCQSHYWITNDRITWDWRWTREEINASRVAGQRQKQEEYNGATGKSSLWLRLKDAVLRRRRN